MSAVAPCVPCCSTPLTTDIPGSTGASAVTVTTASFVIPVVDGVTTVSVTVGDSSWITVGENLYIGGANFIVTGKADATHVTVRSLGFSGDTAAGGTVASGAIVSPGVGNLSSGGITTPVSIANGGTGVATKALAQVALGLGQSHAFYYATGLAQAFTNAYVAIGAALSIASTGLYCVTAGLVVDWLAVTFVAQRTMSFKLRDITAGSDLTNSEITRLTPQCTTLYYPSSDVVMRPGEFTLTAAHQIQLFMKVDTVASAGTHRVNDVWLCPVPLAIS